MNEQEVKNWYNSAKALAASKEKLDDAANDCYYSRNFETVYYGFTHQTPSSEEVQVALNLLQRRLRSIKRDLKTDLGTFISTSAIAMKPENYQDFRKQLIAKGWMPVDPEVERRRLDEERKRLEKEKAEQLRRENEQRERIRREHEEQLRREAERQERERWRRKRKRRQIRNIVLGVFLISFIVIGVLYGIPHYKYYIIEYNALIKSSMAYENECKYDDAINALEQAREKKKGKPQYDRLSTRIQEITKKKEDKKIELRNDIASIWKAYYIGSNLNAKSLRYIEKSEMVPVIQSLENKITLLNEISGDTKEFNSNMNKLKRLKKYYKI